MKIDRRKLIISAGALITPFNAFAQTSGGDKEYEEYDFKDYYDKTMGPQPDLDPNDAQMVEQIIKRFSNKNHVEIMEELESLAEKGSTGELFNTRWKTKGNPLIVRFFHEIGYKKTPYPGDCTPWCAATLSYCLKAAGKSIPHDPASSQSFLEYGTEVSLPRSGDICVFTDLGDASHGHVAFYAGAIGNGNLRILGANQSGAGRPLTDCGPGYRKSRVSYDTYPTNPSRDPNVFSKYLAKYVRPS